MWSIRLAQSNSIGAPLWKYRNMSPPEAVAVEKHLLADGKPMKTNIRQTRINRNEADRREKLMSSA